MIRRIRSVAAVAFVAGGLTFGAFQLRAGGSDPCDGTHGPCVDDPSCAQLCEGLFPENGGAGVCILPQGCCMCAER